MRKSLTMSLILFLLLFLYSSVSFATVPGEINFQGVLKDSAGVLDGRYSMRFAIYPSPEGDSSSVLWEGIYDGPDRILVENGLYSVRLGSIPGNAIPPDVFNGETRYLEVEVGGQTLSPRVPLITVPYAFRAEYANTAVTVPDPLIPSQEVQDIGFPILAERSLFVWGKGAAILGSVSSLGADAYGVGGICIGAGDAVRGINFGNGAGVAGNSAGGDAVVARSSGKNKSGVYAVHSGDSANAGYGIFATSANGTGIYGSGYSAGGMFQSSNSHGVMGRSLASGNAAVYGETVAGKKNIAGVYGKSSDRRGVFGETSSSGRPAYAGVRGENTAAVEGGAGIEGISISGYGVYGYSEQGTGVFGETDDATSYAGSFFGGRGIISDNQVVGQKGVVGGSTGNPYSNQYGGLFFTPSGGRALGVSGNAYITGTSYAKKHTNLGYVALDLAEWVKVNDPSIEKGDVVILDRNIDKSVAKSSAAYSTLVAGIVSTSPAFIAGLHGEGDNVLSDEEMEAKGYRMLALAGQVPCKVSTENGPIERGDLLTTSNTPGYAMKATDPKIGTILGKAMEPLAAGKGKIVVLVTLQ